MLPLLLALSILGLIVVLTGLLWVSFGLVGLALHMFMAGLVGALAAAVVPGRLPWGFMGAILAGLVGSWLGTVLLGHLGPRVFGIPLVPAFVGAVIVAFAFSLVRRERAF
jgi:uncharacterized membrane protein YeaQ/YmgE (transglycosylase-associated protein family)